MRIMETDYVKRTAANGIYMRLFTFHLRAFISLQMDLGETRRVEVEQTRETIAGIGAN